MPARLLSAPNNTLLFEDRRKGQHVVRHIDLSKSDKQGIYQIQSTRIHRAHLYDIVLVEYENNNQLLITTHENRGMYAYEAVTSKLIWKVEGRSYQD